MFQFQYARCRYIEKFTLLQATKSNVQNKTEHNNFCFQIVIWNKFEIIVEDWWISFYCVKSRCLKLNANKLWVSKPTDFMQVWHFSSKYKHTTESKWYVKIRKTSTATTKRHELTVVFHSGRGRRMRQPNCIQISLLSVFFFSLSQCMCVSLLFFCNKTNSFFFSS